MRRFAKWGREKVLSDVVWVIRKFRPDVVILRFSGTPRDGHGQHQASAILGKEAFSAAADKNRFPEQLRYVQPWQAKRLLSGTCSASAAEQEKEARPCRTASRWIRASSIRFWGSRTRRSRASAAASTEARVWARRSGAVHRNNFLVTIAGPPADHDAFDGIDTTWSARCRAAKRLGRILAEAERTFVPEQPEKDNSAAAQSAAADCRYRRSAGETQARRTGRGVGAVQRALAGRDSGPVRGGARIDR